ncbi:hypothetical protein C8T65DRAFT_716785 [Cerioporus squamosus]|nr:hypothetical protein C8T65DRAFT_716785 [Cerioporus squamosus]
MRFLSFISLLAVPATVLACEGDCIVGITNAWLSNYTAPIDGVFNSLAIQISDLIPSHPSPQTSVSFLSPILSAYRKQSYAAMEDAIFPSYFHGKCLDENGYTPSGCPNPDCPIVCGTPGSLVHFFSKLRYIAHNQTSHILQALATPGTDTYQQVEQKVVAAANESPQRRRVNSRLFSRGIGSGPVNAMQNNQGSYSPVPPVPAPGSGSHVPPAPAAAAPSTGEDALPGSGAGSGHPSEFSSIFSGDKGFSSAKKLLPILKPRTQDVKDGLKSIMQQMSTQLKEECGGDGENTNGLPKCSWEMAMKEYILSFP